MATTPQKALRLADHLRQAEVDCAALLGVSAGREEALTELYDEYAPMLLALALKMLRSVSDAEEIVQELFQDVWRNVFSAMEGTVHTWMVASTRDRALARLKTRGHRKQHHASDPQSAWLLPEVIAPSAAAAARDEIIAVMRKAGKEEQQVLALAFYEGFTESEIAEILRRPAPTVRTQLGAALLALHQATPWHDATSPLHEGFTPAAYASRALMALEGDDARRFDAHLALPCESCLLYLRSLRQTAALLPIVLTPVPPPPDLKERILFAIRLSRVAEEDLGEREKRPDPTPGASAPAAFTPEAPAAGAGSHWLMIVGMFLVLLILVGLAAYVNTLIEKVSGQYSYIQGQEGVLSGLKAELHSTRSIASVLESPSLVLVGLEGLPAFRESRGNLFWDAESNRAVLQVSRLPDIPDEMEYRLWIVLKDKSILRSALTTVSGPDSLRTYLTVLQGPAGAHEQAEFVTVVRVRKSDAPESSGEMCLHGDVSHGVPVQRTK